MLTGTESQEHLFWASDPYWPTLGVSAWDRYWRGERCPATSDSRTLKATAAGDFPWWLIYFWGLITLWAGSLLPGRVLIRVSSCTFLSRTMAAPIPVCLGFRVAVLSTQGSLSPSLRRSMVAAEATASPELR